jgi:hypothetical protein
LSRTRKDAIKNTNLVLEVVKRDDGTYDLFLNHSLDRSQIPEMWLPEELRARFGFCGEEYRAILREVNQSGRWTFRSGSNMGSPRL